MKTLIALLITLLAAVSGLGQTVANPGFDSVSPADPSRPANWRVKDVAGYVVLLDSTLARSGRRSLKIASTTPAPEGFQGVSQSCTVGLAQPARIALRATVKTSKNVAVALWCQVWDDSKMIGFLNSEMQGNVPDSTGNWHELTLSLLVTPDAKRFVFGGYLKGTGTAWFDDVRFETASVSGVAPSARVRTYLTKAISLVKKHALVADSIPWKATEATLFSLVAGLQTEQEAHPVIGYLLDVMRRHGDNHSFFQRPASVKALYAAAPTQSVAPTPQPEGRYLGDGVGYVAVPRFWGINTTREAAFSRSIQTRIQQVDSARAVRGWVVDLRQNQGGNMWPMIAGLRPLLGEGTLGYFVKGGRNIPWGTKKYQRLADQYTLQTVPVRIAVLIGPQTASSGEMTAIAFIGPANTRVFGQKSGGYTTANQPYGLPDGAQLFLAVSVTADRTGRQYPTGIRPDEAIKNGPPDAGDETLAAAKAWVMGK